MEQDQISIIVEDFITLFSRSVSNLTFVKMTLGNYRGSEPQLNKALVRPVTTKKGSRIYFQYRYETRDIVKTLALDEAALLLAELLRSGFRSGHLFTSNGDHQLTIGKRSAYISGGKASFNRASSQSHDREKHQLIVPNAFYLKALGISTESGEIRAKQRDKWKQINKFVEVLAGEVERANIDRSLPIKIVDMGSGKGYLTFAAYDYLNNALGIKTEITGIDIKQNTVELCNAIARSGGFDGLTFELGTIADIGGRQTDVLIALHACDTATDDALFQGITANAKVIIAAPCCHKEVKKQLKAPGLLAGILKHPVMLERTAETVTDGIRSLLLESRGYKTKMFEFVATEHTPKNNLIVATLARNDQGDAAKKTANVNDLLAAFNISEQRPSDLLSEAGKCN